jgi:hypothetical protein
MINSKIKDKTNNECSHSQPIRNEHDNIETLTEKAKLDIYLESLCN